MHTHSARVQVPSIESIDQWTASFSAVYTIKDQNIVSLGQIRLPSTGVAVEVIKITPDMLRQDFKLADDIRQLAERGLVGFATADTNVIQFRKDIALQLQDVRQFRVYNHANLQSSHMEDNILVEGVDEVAYSKLANIHSESTEKAEKEKKKHEKAIQNAHVTHRVRHAHTGPVTLAKVSAKSSVRESTKIAASTPVQQEYEHRITRTKARKKIEAKREKEKIDKEEIKREDKNKEISNKKIRSERITSTNKRDEAKKIVTKKTERKRKTEAPIEASPEPTKRKKTKSV